MTSGSFNPLSAAALLFGAALLAAGHARADQVIPDDLIVQGSICAGFDCVNNESFGFDTLILKENNLRIFFNDTSTGAGFAANKWRLVANDFGKRGSKFLRHRGRDRRKDDLSGQRGRPDGIALRR